MRANERRCEVCGDLADPAATSAHHARVIWLCGEHGEIFQGSVEWREAKGARTTAECWRLVDEWLDREAQTAYIRQAFRAA